MSGQPLYSMVVTAGLRYTKTEADYGSEDYVEFTGLNFITKMQVFLEDGGFAAKLWVELCRDGDETAAGNEAPIWHYPIVVTKAAPNYLEHLSGKNEEVWFQPLEAPGTIQVQLRHTYPYPNGTVFKPSTTKLVIMLEGFPTSYTGYSY